MQFLNNNKNDQHSFLINHEVIIINSLQKFLQKRVVEDYKIYALYKKFLEFMCSNIQTPKFKINYTSSNIDNNIKYSAQVNLYRKPIILNINIAQYDLKNINSKATMFHEFTHIFDYYNFEQYLTDIEIKQGFKLYSEFHATQISLLYEYNIIDNIKQSFDSFNFNDKQIKLKSITQLIELNKKGQHYYNTCKEYIENSNFDNFDRVKVAYMYTIAITILLKNLLNIEPRVLTFINPYKRPYQEIVDILSNTHYSLLPQLNTFRLIGKIDQLVTDDFCKKQKIH